MSLRKVTTSFAKNAAQATSRVTLVVNMMIHICLRLMEAFLKRVISVCVFIVFAFDRGRRAQEIGAELQSRRLRGYEVYIEAHAVFLQVNCGKCNEAGVGVCLTRGG